MSAEAGMTLLGLVLDLIGAVLLFFFTSPKKKHGNVVMQGRVAFKLDAANERDVPESEWRPVQERFIRRNEFLTKLGFGLLVMGAAFQIAALVVNPSP